MRRTTVRLVVLLWAGLAAGAYLPSIQPAAWAASGTSKRIRPVEHGGVVKVRVVKKTHLYHAASKQKPVVLRVKGPVTLRLLSRYLYPAHVTAAPRTYHLRVEIDGVELRTISEKAVISKAASTARGGKIGSLEKSNITIPAGDHRVRLYPTEEKARLALRTFLGTRKRSSTKWVPFAPEKFVQAVRVLTKEQETTYYRFHQAAPVEITIHGPLRLDVGTRVDFEGINGYTQAYVVKAILDGVPWKSFALKARASHTATYPDLPEITPGQEKSVALDVPSGTHLLVIALEGTAASGASLKIRVPERDLRIGQKQKPRP